MGGGGLASYMLVMFAASGMSYQLCVSFKFVCEHKKHSQYAILATKTSPMV